MKIKLIYSPRYYTSGRFGYQDEHSHLPPLGIATVKSFIELQGYNVSQDDLDIKTWYDNTYSKNPFKKVDMSVFDDKKRIARFMKTKKDKLLEKEARKILSKTDYKGYDIYGFSIVDDHNFSAIGAIVVLAKIIKEKTGGIIVIGGLRHTRKIHEISLIDLDFIDFAVLDDHVTFFRLLKNLEKEDFRLSQWNLITFQRKKIPKFKIFSRSLDKNALKKISSLADDVDNRWDFNSEDIILPKPDFDGLPMELYKRKIGEKQILIIPYSFVVGCNIGCIFCPNSESPHPKNKNPHTVAKEVKELSEKYKSNYFIFLNTNINPSIKYGELLADELIKNNVNVNWMSCANFKQLTPTLLKKLRKAGGIKLIYGLESASPKLLKYIHKGTTILQVENLLEESHKLGIWNELELISGIPYETKNDEKKTIEFIKRNQKFIDYFHVAKYILMNSAITKNPKKYGIENIRENVKTVCDMKHLFRAFDEKNGLKWKEKEIQIENAYKGVCDTICNLNKTLSWTKQKNYYGVQDTHLLFYLYDKYKKKSKILNVLQHMNKS